MKNRLAVLIILFSLAALLTPSGFQIIYIIIIEPIAYYWWRIKLVFKVVPQAAYWITSLISLGILFSLFLWREFLLQKKEKEREIHHKGPVQALAEYLSKSERSNYFKWLIANRLAKLTLLSIKQRGLDLDQKEGDFSSLNHLTTPEIRNYLESGYKCSFLEYRRRRKWFYRQKTTPFDLYLPRVIDFNESQLE